MDIEHSLCYFSRYLSIRATVGSAEAEERLWQSVQSTRRPFQRIKLKELVNLVGKGGKTDKFVGVEAAVRKLKELHKAQQ